MNIILYLAFGLITGVATLYVLDDTADWKRHDWLFMALIVFTSLFTWPLVLVFYVLWLITWLLGGL